jgi:hypothetical protein
MVEEVMKRYGTPGLGDGALRQLEVKLSEDHARRDHLASLEQIDRRLKLLEEELLRLKKGARSGEIKLSSYDELKTDVDEEIKNLLAARRLVETALEETPDNRGVMEAMRRNLEALDLWSSLDLTRQREILFGLLRRAEVYRPRGSKEPTSIQLTWEA